MRYDDLTREQLINLLVKRDAQRRLGLVWERDEIEIDAAANADFVAVNLQSNLCVGSEPYENLVIEGDNFDALRWLRISHRNAIKCIYIDPPYNTGKRDFVYNDRFVQKEDRFRHSKWLDWLHRRIVLAKDLLTDDGLMFVSIDDIEFARAKLLLDEVFGEKRCMATLVWETDGNVDNQAKFKISHEYILVYAKDPDRVSPPPVIDPNIEDGTKLHAPEIRNTIVKNGPKNPVSDIALPAGFPAEFDRGVIRTRDVRWPEYSADLTVEKGKLKHPVVARSGWANKRLCESFIASGFQPVIDSKGQMTRFVLSRTGAIENVKVRTEQQSHVTSVIRNVGSVQSNGKRLADMGIRFSFPKPVGLIEYLLRMVSGKDFVVLDFFAGSGTTGEAVLNLNAKDHGKRRFILAASREATEEEPSKNLCRDACAARLRAVIEAMQEADKEDSNDLPSGFAYLATERIGFSDIAYDLSAQSIWLVAQAMHGLPLQPAREEAPVQEAWGEDRHLVAYVDRVTPAALKQLNASVAQARSSTIYTHTPGQLPGRIAKAVGVDVRAVPDELLRRFTA